MHVEAPPGHVIGDIVLEFVWRHVTVLSNDDVTHMCVYFFLAVVETSGKSDWASAAICTVDSEASSRLTWPPSAVQTFHLKYTQTRDVTTFHMKITSVYNVDFVSLDPVRWEQTRSSGERS